MFQCFASVASLLMLTIVSLGQAKTMPTHAQKMSFQFTTLALKSLRMIIEYEGAPEQPDSDHISASPTVIGPLGDAQDAARSKQELQAFALLRAFLSGKIANNVSREYFVEASWDAWVRAHPNVSESFIQQARPANRATVFARPIMHQMSEAESACSEALDSMLRSGSYHEEPQCSDVVISITEEKQRR